MPYKDYAEWIVSLPSIDWNTMPTTISLELPKKSIPNVRHVQFNKNTGHTTIVWSDGTSTVVHCGEGETFEPYMGFCAAIVKKLFGSSSAAKKLMDEKDVDAIAARKQKENEERIAKQKEMEANNHKRKVRSMAKRLELMLEAEEYINDKTGVTKMIDDLFEELKKSVKKQDVVANG